MNIPRKRSGRPSNRPTDAELAMLYSSMTAKQLAAHYKVSVPTVRAWIQRARTQK